MMKWAWLLLVLLCQPERLGAQEVSWAAVPTATGYRVEVRAVSGTWRVLPVSYVCVDGTCTAHITPPKGVRLYRITALRGNEATARADAGIWLDGRVPSP